MKLDVWTSRKTGDVHFRMAPQVPSALRTFVRLSPDRRHRSPMSAVTNYYQLGGLK